MNVEGKLSSIGFKPSKGQNFLDSINVVEAMVEAAEVEGKTVLEIGPGTGSITGKLAEKAEKVLAVEKDTVLSEYLERELGEKIEVVNKDFLEYEIPEEVVRVISNLPFQITSETLEKLGEKQLMSVLIVQREVAEKWTASPGEKDYGSSSVKAQYYFVPVKLRDLGSSSFYPQPDVEASIVKLYPNNERHGIKDEEAFFKTVKALFINQNKKARNSFVDSRHIIGMEKKESKEIRDEMPHSEERVKNLSIRQLEEISEFIESRK